MTERQRHETPAAGAALLAAAQQLQVDRTAADAVAALSAAGVPTVLLKGPSFATWLYGPGERRVYRDVDLLVPPPLARAEQVLAGVGFRRASSDGAEPWPKHAKLWMRERDGAAVDLHHSFHGVMVDHATAWRELAAHGEPLVVAGREVVGLDVVGRVLVLALHAAADGPGRAQRELVRAAALVSDHEWAAALELARALGSDDAFVAALHHGPPEAQAVARRLDLPTQTSVVWFLRSADGGGARHIAVHLERLATLPTFRAKAAFLARCLVPTREQVRLTQRVHPERSQGLLSGYAWHAFGCARWASRGVRDWRDARRQASRRGGFRPPDADLRDSEPADADPPRPSASGV